jgi:hypothetical protein
MNNQTQTLASISPEKLEQFLLALANLSDDLLELKAEPNPVERRFAAFIPAPSHRSWCFDQVQFEEDAELKTAFPASIQDKIIEKIGMRLWQLPSLREFVRRVWTLQDPRRRDWAVDAFRYWLYTLQRDKSLEGEFLNINPDSNWFPQIPPPTPFEQALLYLVKYADKACYCRNPECPAPYFFTKRKNQRYCSESCAAPAQRDMKRKWWAEHGEEWRAARQNKKGGKDKGGVKGEKRGQKQSTKKAWKGGK